MLFVFIDTNVLLRFYAYSDDTLNEIEKITALIKTKKIEMLITEQVIDEHARNRDREIAESIKKIEQIPTSAQIPRFAEHHDGTKKLFEAVKAVKSAKVELMDAVMAELNDGGLRADKLINEMFSLSHILNRSSEIFQKARIRRELGNPPGKKDSLGDQINWEILLSHVPEKTDIHIISRDGDFKSQSPSGGANFFLCAEWERRKSAKLHIYNGLAEFAKAYFPDINVPSDAIKMAAIEQFLNSSSFSQTHQAVALLDGVKADLDDDERVLILTAATKNPQIYSIIGDEDVNSLLSHVYDEVSLITSSSLDKALNDLSPNLGVPF